MKVLDRMTSLIALLAAILCLAGPTSAGPASIAATVESISRSRLKALVPRDLRGFQKYYAAGFSLTLDTGQRVGIKYLMDFAAHYPGKFTFEPANYHVLVSKDRTMAFTDHDLDEKYYKPDGTLGEEDHTVFTEVWIKQDGRWLIVHEQYGTVPKSSPKA